MRAQVTVGAGWWFPADSVRRPHSPSLLWHAIALQDKQLPWTGPIPGSITAAPGQLTVQFTGGKTPLRLESIAQTSTNGSGFEVTSDPTVRLSATWLPVSATAVNSIGLALGEVVLNTSGINVTGLRYVRDQRKADLMPRFRLNSAVCCQFVRGNTFFRSQSWGDVPTAKFLFDSSNLPASPFIATCSASESSLNSTRCFFLRPRRQLPPHQGFIGRVGWPRALTNVTHPVRCILCSHV